MVWTDYFDCVVVPNLPERRDRLDRIETMLFDYGIEAVIWEATKHADGKIGLVTTMKDIFKWALSNKHERLFVMEDDCDIVVGQSEFHKIMELCCNDLNELNWDLFYAGVQHPIPFEGWQTPNLLRVKKGYSTHAVGYSKRIMEFVVSAHIEEPIDNFLVNNFQKYGTSFCSFPLLCSQVAGYSNIGNDYIDWGVFIKGTFDRSIRNILINRFKQTT